MFLNLGDNSYFNTSVDTRWQAARKEGGTKRAETQYPSRQRFEDGQDYSGLTADMWLSSKFTMRFLQALREI